MRIVAKGTFRQDASETIAEFTLGPDYVRAAIIGGTIVLCSAYLALSLYKIRLFGVLLPPPHVKQGGSPAGGMGSAGPPGERLSLRRNKKSLMHSLIRAIAARVVAPTSTDS